MIAKYINKEGNFSSRVSTYLFMKKFINVQGYKIKIGDTLKFGRVRFKVIMMKNEVDGFQEYKVNLNKVKAVSLDNTNSDNEKDNNINNIE